MTRPFLLSPKHLKEQAHAKMDPEFATATKELELAHRHADEMLAAGTLTKEEHDHFEAHLYSKFIDALPVSEFEELVKNGGMDHLQSLAGYEGDHDAGDIVDTRRAIEAKIKADALDMAWADSRIDDKYYAENSQQVNRDIHHFDEKMDVRLADEDYSSAAGNYFVERHDVPDHDRDLTSYLKGKYSDAPGPATKRNSSYDKPEGFVEHNQIADVPYASTNAFNEAVTTSINELESSDGIISYD
jgi:hypothetical protein